MKRVILVVDDELESVMLLEEILVQEGYEVISARSGREGLEKVRECKPDLVISDVVMPEMDGFTFLKELRKDPAISHTPIFIITVREKMWDTFSLYSPQAFLTKPLNPPQLISEIQACFGEDQLPAWKQTEDESTKRHKRVMIAGHLAPVIKSLANQLNQHNCDVQVFLTGKDFIEKAEAFVPDLILLDVFIADCQSQQIIQQIRKSKNLYKKPVIIFGSVEEDEKRVIHKKVQKQFEESKTACVNAGATEFMGNFTEDNLPEKIFRIRNYIR